MTYNPQIASSVLGLAGFVLLPLWQNTAPKLSDLRDTDASDNDSRRKLFDADILTGGIALTLGLAFAVMSKDYTPLLLMLIIFGFISIYYHYVFGADVIAD
ncbi:MAG: hypothetical protein ACYCZF_13805 [Anaerolineae bacterium]